MFLNNVYTMFLKIAAVRIKKKRKTKGKCFRFFSVYLKNETTPQLMWLHAVDCKKQGSAEEKRKKKDRQTLFTIKSWLYPLSITSSD